MGSHTFEAGERGDVRQVLDGLRRLVQVLRESSRAAERRVGITSAQLFVLQRLAGERALSLNELAARTFTHQSSVSVVVSRLVERGLVARVEAAEDRRRLALSLTAAGRSLVARAPGAPQAQLVTAIERLSPTRRRGLGAGLRALIGEMAMVPAVPSMLFEDGDSPARSRVRLPVRARARGGR